MDKIDLEKYLEKLESFERTLSRDEDVDDKFIEGVEEVLQSLSMDAMRHMGKDYTSPKNTQPELGVLTTLRCNIKKFDPTAIIPTYSKEGDAGMDLTITSIIDETPHDITYGFGIGFEVPKGFVGLVFPRSSIRKMDLLLTNSVGVIDSGYRGEIQATFKKTESGNKNYYKVGERAAQIMIVPYPNIQFIEVDELNTTERGVGGFGSTGK
jgi:dUTP pyrophosphatase